MSFASFWAANQGRLVYVDPALAVAYIEMAGSSTDVSERWAEILDMAAVNAERRGLTLVTVAVEITSASAFTVYAIGRRKVT
jgi:hypothetical protein